MAHQRSMAFGDEVVTLFRALPIDAAESLAAKLATHPDVALAQPDYVMHAPEKMLPTALTQPQILQPKLMPNDPLLQGMGFASAEPVI